ncbi:MAG: hypothetical protein AAGA87_16580 [Pseudomonadota bacterium]
MFGNAAALIGSGMLIGGAYADLVATYEDIAGFTSIALSLPIAFLAGRSLRFGGVTARFVAGSILLMATALHLAGVGLLAEQYGIGGIPRAGLFLYASVLIAGAGWFTNARAITALALVPFAQMLDTSTNYFHAAYVFYSPESTLSILQMTLLVVGCVILLRRASPGTAPHLRILAVMGFVVGNLCALVGSLWGDVVGGHVWGPYGHRYRFEDWEAYRDARDAFRETTVFISADTYSVLWAVALIVILLWAANRGMRGLFNTAVTFLVIHGYTQAFESFHDEPLAYVIGGFAAIPLAWGMWRLNQRFLEHGRV